MHGLDDYNSFRAYIDLRVSYLLRCRVDLGINTFHQFSSFPNPGIRRTMKENAGSAPIKTIRRSERYEDSLIFERKQFSWPKGKTLAVWIIPNVEAWTYDSPHGLATSPNTRNAVPDVINYAWREYGIRVGLWRIADVLRAARIRATVALNSSVCDVFPRAMAEMKKLGWEFMGHGITNSQLLSSLSNPEEETEVIRIALGTIEQAAGKRPKGWLGPALAENYDTLDILAAEGVSYVGDWNNDDQPYRMKVKTGKMLSIPYCMELNDIGFFARNGYTGKEYLDAIVDQFETLYSESKNVARVMGIPLHPFLVGQPLRIKYFQRAIAHMQKRNRVWFATGSEIAEAYERVSS
jgi:peptidoglycan/xylan/chitin deacetylase (PgdA/CDA1 family)